MVIIINKDELLKSKRKYLKLLKNRVFIYPTDSIYGIGCDATNKELVDEIRRLKKSTLQPFSIIVPNKEWAYENCIVEDKQKKYVEKLGKKITLADEEYCWTLILKIKNKDAVAKNVLNGLDAIGLRMPDHWFSKIVEELAVPIITTSANPTGEDFMTSLDDLNEKIKKSVSLIVYEGPKEGYPSTIIHADDSKETIRIKDRSK
jgi:L-threonylcarbamoyladenylate synthase